jgi:uncharacterized membrane protein
VSTFDLIVRVLHVVSAAIWLGAAIFVGWFLMPAIIEAGPDGGKVMGGIQRRGWVAVAPVIAVLTIVSGIYLYVPYMGSPSTVGRMLGAGGVIGIVAMILGAAVVSRTMAQANALTAQMATTPEGPARQDLIVRTRGLRAKGLLYTRVVSILVLVAAMLMAAAAYV